jgi:hypothetical protein
MRFLKSKSNLNRSAYSEISQPKRMQKLRQSSSLRLRRLPQLHPVTPQIPNPRKPPIVGIFPSWVDPHPCVGHLRCQIAYPKVHQHLLPTLPEIRRAQGKMGENRHPGRLRPIKRQRPSILRLNAKLGRTPGRQRADRAPPGKLPPTPTAWAMASSLAATLPAE